MSKYLKSLITACLVVCMMVCVGIFAAGCTEPFPTSVSIKVVGDDGKPVDGVFVGICIVGDDGTTGSCLRPVETDENGVATIAIKEENGKNYEVHLSTIPPTYIYVDEHDNPYGTEDGIRIDVTKTPSLTITLKSVSNEE